MSAVEKLRRPRTLVTGVVAVVVLLVCGSPSASADPPPPRFADTGANLSVAYGPACAGQVHASAVSTERLYSGPGAGGVSTGTRDNRGIVSFSGGGVFFGVSGTGQACAVTLTIHWRNTTTRTAGTIKGVVSGLLVPVAPYATIGEDVRTGSGRVEFWVSTDRPHIAAAPAAINVY